MTIMVVVEMAEEGGRERKGRGRRMREISVGEGEVKKTRRGEKK